MPVVVRQNGYQIYQTYVAPGAFEITDMYPTGGAGDLDVTIKEADGSEQHFTLPYASLPVLQREGRLKYALTGGQYRSYNHNVDKTPFGQITGIYGLSRGVTLYGGLQASSKYQSVAAGLGKNMGDLGAISADVTGLVHPAGRQKINGQSGARVTARTLWGPEPSFRLQATATRPAVTTACRRSSILG